MLYIINTIKILSILISSFGYYYCINQNKKYHTISEFAQIHSKIYITVLLFIKFMFFFSIFLNILNLHQIYSIVTTFGALLTLIKLNTSKLIHYIGVKIFIITPIIHHYYYNKIVSFILSLLLILFVLLLFNTNSKLMKNITLAIEFSIILVIMLNY
jgi:hypothetical protein